MAIYQFITNTFTKPMIERHTAAAKAEAKSQGMAQGRAEADRLWREWNQRRMDAAANGLPFNEPLPTNPD